MLQECKNITESPFQVMNIIKDKSDQLQYKKGQLIYCEDNTPLGVYFVFKGKVKISKMGSDGKEQILRIATPDDMLSYSDLVSNTKYSTSANALEDTTLLFVSKQEFWNIIRTQRQLLENFVLQLSLDLKQAETKIADLAYKPVRGRLADALITLTNKFNVPKTCASEVSISRADLACFVGTAKETVNRLLSEFRNEHLISTEGTKINIIDMKGLSLVSNMYK